MKVNKILVVDQANGPRALSAHYLDKIKLTRPAFITAPVVKLADLTQLELYLSELSKSTTQDDQVSLLIQCADEIKSPDWTNTDYQEPDFETVQKNQNIVKASQMLKQWQQKESAKRNYLLIASRKPAAAKSVKTSTREEIKYSQLNNTISDEGYQSFMSGAALPNLPFINNSQVDEPTSLGFYLNILNHFDNLIRTSVPAAA